MKLLVALSLAAACSGADGVADGVVDAEPVACSADMVHVSSQGVCIDKYEASAGLDGAAQSHAGVVPWNLVTWQDASVACERAGKRLCSDQEWLAACRGPGGNSYRTAMRISMTLVSAGIRGPSDRRPRGVRLVKAAIPACSI